MSVTFTPGMPVVELVAKAEALVEIVEAQKE